MAQASSHISSKGSLYGPTQPLPSLTSSLSERAPPVSDICAKFVTTTEDGRSEALMLSVGRPMTIGRNPALCSYVIPSIVVSNLHCKIYAVRSSTGGTIISCQDLSTNGLIINDHKIRKNSAIIMNGDLITIPGSQTFQCVMSWKALPDDQDVSNSEREQHKFGRYVITSHCLGSGSYATVRLATDTSAHRQVACKMIRRKDGGDSKKEMQEATLLMNLHHPNINRIYYVEADSEFLYIMLQLCTGGDLFTYITTNAKHRLCEGESKYIMYQILKALRYLHDRMISHRDLKPENILLFSPGPYPRIQIADFGLARPKAYQETLHVCGTVSYLPPEGVLALDNKKLGYVGMPADCWSAGVTLFAMISGCHPFDCGNCPTRSDQSISDIVDSQGFVQSPCPKRQEEKIKERILDAQVFFAPYVWNSLHDAKDLVRQLLISQPDKRATVYTALETRWIMSDIVELQRAYCERVQSFS